MRLYLFHMKKIININIIRYLLSLLNINHQYSSSLFQQIINQWSNILFIISLIFFLIVFVKHD
jgi:hypothetical protein